MLKELRIQNLILISSTSIPFSEGFNILSGETGAGKSAVIKALHLLAGDKGDTTIIRHGADKAVVEGLFDIDKIPGVAALLESANIDHEAGEMLIVRREVSLTGKGRCSINNQSTQLSLLRKVGDLLLDMVGQHANQKLLSTDSHRRITDLFGNLTEEVAAFGASWHKQQQLAADLDALVRSEAQRLRDSEVCSLELEELRDARLQEGEEEELFAEYSRLSNADEIATHLQEISQTLNGERLSAIALLKKQAHAFDQLVKLDPSIEEAAQAHKNALMELQEVAYSVDKLSGLVEHNPQRLAHINERLTLINKLKRKYGATVAEVRAYEQAAAEKLQRLESADEQIEEGKAALAALAQHNQRLAEALTSKRRQAGAQLSEALTKELAALNMPKAQFEIDISPGARTSQGDDAVEFFLIPNIGEKRIPIREHASGGELSRILLALQTLLAGKESVATLVFDEIDANIGGATAVVIGEKLKEIGGKHQVLCITHFPQVAKQADHHIQIEKREEEGRTFSHITRLDMKGRKKELDRMSGLVAK